MISPPLSGLPGMTGTLLWSNCPFRRPCAQKYLRGLHGCRRPLHSKQNGNASQEPMLAEREREPQAKGNQEKSSRIEYHNVILRRIRQSGLSSESLRLPGSLPKWRAPSKPNGCPPQRGPSHYGQELKLF